MSLSTINVPSLHNGVSQQSPTVRSTDQAEVQENGWSSIADGLLKRPPLEHLATLIDSPRTGVYVHEINRDVTERYVVIAAEGEIRVFDLDGNEKTVVAPAGFGYLAEITDAAAELSMTTIADYTFITNRNVVPRMRVAPEDTVPGVDPVLPPLEGQDNFVEPRSLGGAREIGDPVLP